VDLLHQRGLIRNLRNRIKSFTTLPLLVKLRQMVHLPRTVDQPRCSSPEPSFLQRARSTLSPTLTSLALYVLYTLFLPRDPYPIIYSGLIIPKMVHQSSFSRITSRLTDIKHLQGMPVSEMRRTGQPPRMLSPEEQEKMRTVCRVGPYLIPQLGWHRVSIRVAPKAPA